MTEEKDEQIEDKISKRVFQLTNHYIICGFGPTGRQIVSELINENIPYVIVEEDSKYCDELLNNGYNFIRGSASSDEVLIAAGIKTAKGFVAVYPSDEFNALVILAARALNLRLDISAISAKESNENILRKSGADKVISLRMLDGKNIADTVFDFNKRVYYRVIKKFYFNMLDLYGWLSSILFSIISIVILFYNIINISSFFKEDINIFKTAFIVLLLLNFSLLAFFRINLRIKGDFTKKEQTWVLVINIILSVLTFGFWAVVFAIDYIIMNILSYKAVNYKLTVLVWLIFFYILMIYCILAVIRIPISGML